MQSTTIIEAGTILKVVPVGVAIMVWVIRVLVIGSISSMGSRLLWGEQRPVARPAQRATRPTTNHNFENSVITPAVPRPVRSASAQSTPRTGNPRTSPSRTYQRPEPTYHSMSSGENDTHSTKNTRNFS